jgi:hypothetical protein
MGEVNGVSSRHLTRRTIGVVCLVGHSLATPVACAVTAWLRQLTASQYVVTRDLTRN